MADERSIGEKEMRTYHVFLLCSMVETATMGGIEAREGHRGAAGNGDCAVLLHLYFQRQRGCSPWSLACKLWVWE